jgi:hypothetical protein
MLLTIQLVEYSKPFALAKIPPLRFATVGTGMYWSVNVAGVA